MWFNSTQREEPYLGLTCRGNRVETLGLLRDPCTGAAWLSSARVVRCWVKSRNERNPRSQLPARNGGDSGYTARAKRAGTEVCEPAMASQSPKAVHSADWRLQLASMKLESLVIVDQLRHGEYVPGPCTHRPSRHGSCERPKSVSELAREQAAEGERSDWGEVVTR